MSQVFNGQTGGGGGLTEVATDATLTGDGTVGDPLSVVPTTSAYSVSKTVFTNGALPPLTIPAMVWPQTDTWYNDAISSTDVDYSAGFIRFFNDGTYRVSMQLSFEHLPSPSTSDIQFNFGLTDALPNPPTMETVSFTHFDTNGAGVFSINFEQVVQVTAGQGFYVAFHLTGSAGTQMNYYVGADAGWIVVERLV